MFMDFEDTSQSTNNEVQPTEVNSDLVNGYDKLPECENGYLNVCHVDENTDAKMIRLEVDDTFEDWHEVDIIVNKYAKQNGFVAIKSRKDLDPIDKTIVRRCTYSCWKSGINKQKKVVNINLHRESVSNKTECSWEVSFYYGKIQQEIHLTKINNSHNHLCDPITIDLAPKNTRLSQSILDKIEHYTTNGHLNAGQQYDLLLKEFPQFHIKKKNLYNAIQKFRGVRIHDESDAATMFSYLIEQRNKDPDIVVTAQLEGPHNELTGLFWMTSKQRVESTQRVESINSVLKRHLDRGTLLKELVKVIESELDKEAEYNRTRDYYGSNVTIGLPSTYNTIFKDIDSILKDHLTPIT
ncbi:45437_t:CDS:2, partial [Gigaspora margarita]